MIDDYRLKQSRDQARAIDDRGKTKVTRVGGRDTEFGYETVIEPDGSTRRVGLKTYNAELEPGTPVLATDRADGLTTLQSLKADPSSKVVPKIFGRQPDPEKVDLWALGLQDIGGDDGSYKLFLLNLKFGASYLVSEWVKQIPGCDRYAGIDPGSHPQWFRQWDWTVTTTGQDGTTQTNGGATEGSISARYSLVVIDMYSLPVGPGGISSARQPWEGPWWGFGVYYTENGGGFTAYLTTSSGYDFSTNPPTLTFEAIAPIITNLRVTYEENPPNDDPSGPPQPAGPRGNTAAYSLSVDNGLPTVRLKHTPSCTAGDPFGFDKAFILVGATLSESPGNLAGNDWRVGPFFRCQSSLKDNQFVNFGLGRAFYWNGNATIAEYTRPQTIALNESAEFIVSKVYPPESGACLVPGISNKSIMGIYSGAGMPSSLSIVAIAAY